MCTQRELYPRSWWKHLLLLPMVLALGIGLAINNARAVLEALFGHQSEFTRTPKYGIRKRGQQWRGAVYIPIKNILPLVELAFAIYFFYLFSFALAYEQWLNAAFLGLFLAGFAYVALCSIAQWVPSVREDDRDSGALPA
jgi:hypothetical protein